MNKGIGVVDEKSIIYHFIG